MKPAACILLIVWTILLAEPGFSSYHIKALPSSCMKKVEVEKPSCSKSKCSKTSTPVKQEENDDCKNNRCNPLMSCPTGNFYLSGHPHLAIAPLIILKQKTVLKNDNRISKQLSECWHPPEII
jgi:hypothetical protein